ncbi:uncharacterized protein LOC129759070 [Uranotaenia lowii]|uniref:uncharacterized protein LOC129759070 n=1 Tax=Uranotaenia lowii TaxID=190385 RepID=UPI00247951F0|nr:uncharacterized protein LOC129759070 [Uranotaenia lowii]
MKSSKNLHSASKSSSKSSSSSSGSSLGDKGRRYTAPVPPPVVPGILSSGSSGSSNAFRLPSSTLPSTGGGNRALDMKKSQKSWMHDEQDSRMDNRMERRERDKKARAALQQQAERDAEPKAPIFGAPVKVVSRTNFFCCIPIKLHLCQSIVRKGGNGYDPSISSGQAQEQMKNFSAQFNHHTHKEDYRQTIRAEKIVRLAPGTYKKQAFLAAVLKGADLNHTE